MSNPEKGTDTQDEAGILQAIEVELNLPVDEEGLAIIHRSLPEDT
jgi:hypothetical protein